MPLHGALRSNWMGPSGMFSCRFFQGCLRSQLHRETGHKKQMHILQHNLGLQHEKIRRHQVPFLLRPPCHPSCRMVLSHRILPELEQLIACIILQRFHHLPRYRFLLVHLDHERYRGLGRHRILFRCLGLRF